MTGCAQENGLPLKRVIDRIESGVSVNSVDIPAEPEQLGVLKTSCVYTGRFERTENKAIFLEEYERVACPVRGGTIVVSRMNTPELVGAAGFVPTDEPNLYLPDRLWQVSIDSSKAEPRFVYWWTQSSMYREQVRMACAGSSSSMQNLDQNSFRSLKIPPVTRTHQTHVANFLDEQTARVDALIAEKEQLLRRLDELRASVVWAEVTGQSAQVRQPIPESPWSPSVPADWMVTPVGRFAHLQRGFDLPEDRRTNGSFPVVSGGGVMGRHGEASVAGPGVVIGRYGTLGVVHFIEEDFWPLNTSLFVNNFFGNNPKYAYYVLGLLPWDMVSAKSAVPGVDRNDVHPLRVGVPSREEQDLIVARLNHRVRAFGELSEHTLAHTARLREYRSSLISATVTGQLDIDRYMRHLEMETA